MTNPEIPEAEVYSVVGEEGFRRLVAAFYQRVPDDDLLGPMYPPDDLDGAEWRLREFLVFRFGGPPRYIENRGHPALRMRHAPFPLTPAARDRWVELMDAALAEADLDSRATAVLRSFFEKTATFLVNRPAD